ncbi:helix-turn-helix domain-containing protein [Bradyrhizobium sp. CCBAU 21362]|uniref:helix-turn-helix domain-containing protein n=1 Tax=Bradyrhizobium sp. CCBAU 21362 TaxID=1325082 RepID=UPI0012F48A98|nr:helix-turn-helix transcriptional regulator [Bradyrhizobium sp. CCBAU 21362]
MKLERSKEWWMARARREGDAVIGAGLLAFDPAPDTRPAAAQQTAAVEETRIAFGKFVNLMRRRRGFSMERLAEVAELDASELLVIEDDVHYVPEPRTVFKLAQTFAVSQRRLMQLAGLAAANDAGLRQEAVRFAARSEAVQKLTPEENSALEAFVAVLSEQDPKRAK